MNWFRGLAMHLFLFKSALTRCERRSPGAGGNALAIGESPVKMAKAFKVLKS
jgi:hypothetical protein